MKWHSDVVLVAHCINGNEAQGHTMLRVVHSISGSPILPSILHFFYFICQLWPGTPQEISAPPHLFLVDEEMSIRHFKSANINALTTGGNPWDIWGLSATSFDSSSGCCGWFCVSQNIVATLKIYSCMATQTSSWTGVGGCHLENRIY